jgi:hypothetical protein
MGAAYGEIEGNPKVLIIPNVSGLDEVDAGGSLAVKVTTKDLGGLSNYALTIRMDKARQESGALPAVNSASDFGLGRIAIIYSAITTDKTVVVQMFGGGAAWPAGYQPEIFVRLYP